MNVLRIAFIVLALFGGLIFAFIRKAESGNEHAKAMCQRISLVEGYDKAKDYYDGLVYSAHDLCFDDAHHMESAGRRRVKTWVDEDQYFNDMMKTMIRLAEQDNAPHIATALQRFYDKELGIEPPPEEKPKQKRKS